MDEPDARVDQLTAQAAQLRIRAIEANQAVIEELQVVWHELNECCGGRTEVRRTCDRIAADIARLEKLDLALDTEWLADARRARP